MSEVITIPREFLKRGELVIIPRSEYEAFLNWQKLVKIFKPNAADKRALREARKDFSRGYYIPLEKLKYGIGGSYSSQSRKVSEPFPQKGCRAD